MKSFYEKISHILEDTIKKEYGIMLEPPLWELPQRQEFGDLSSMAALKLASQLKKDPLEIASSLQVILEKTLSKEAAKIEVLKPGFINLYFNRQVLIGSLNSLLKSKGGFFRQNQPLAGKKKVLLEFVSANPTGPLSIAHGRQAVIGDVIANILSFFGNRVTREYYINDSGRQINLLVASVKAWLGPNKEKDIPEDGYRAKYVEEVAAKVKTKKRGLKEAILKHILNDLIKKDLNKLGIKFDSWVSQGELIAGKRVEEAVGFLKGKGLIYEKEGALWFSSTKFGDDKDRVIKKADGELTYFAADIAYHRDKIRRKFDKLINLWGPDHHGYIERVFSAIEACGKKREILKIIIIQLVTLKTKERMSKRAGTLVLLSQLLDAVGRDATRFYYLTRRNSSHLEFDLDLAREASFNNPFYYIQYACARIESIFKKAKTKEIPLSYSRFLNDEEELRLLRLLLQFSYELEKAYYSLEPVFIIEYLKTLASGLHQFYEKRRVLGENKEVMFARLGLLEATKIVLCCGLNLLGIKPAKKM